MSAASTNVRVTTYNVLSSQLARSDYFTFCNPKWLQASHRLGKIKEKMEVEVAKKSIICLQEVSTYWAGNLHSYFAARGYHFITGLYGSKFNGYMGVGVAVPMSEYDIIDADVTRVADTKKMVRAPKKTGLQLLVSEYIYWPFMRLIKALGWYKPPKDVWDEATNRFNQMVMVRLRPKALPRGLSQQLGEAEQASTSASFVVGTYHMPCIFRIPQIMMIHCSLSAQLIHKYAAGSPYVYCGDFNIKPDSAMYLLLRDGSVSPTIPEYPKMQEGDSWLPDVAPLKSAYVQCAGKEPEYTNNARIVNEEPFIETLDYIFTSSAHDWKVDKVQELGTKAAVTGPLPSEEEPSDHVLLSADMRLNLD